MNGSYIRTGFDLHRLSGFGAKVWKSIPYWPWVIYGISVVGALFTENFWGIVGTIIFGCIGAFIAQLILTWSMGILEWIRDLYLSFPKWLRRTLWISLLGLIVYGAWIEAM